MMTALDVIAAWAALDVALLVAWHLAHTGSRRSGARHPAPRSAGPCVHTLPPQVRLGDAPLTLVPALPG